MSTPLCFVRCAARSARPRAALGLLGAGILVAGLQFAGCSSSAATGDAAGPVASAERSDPAEGRGIGTRDRWARRGDPALGQFDVPAPLSGVEQSELRRTAVDLLTRAASSNHALLRANAIESLEPVPEALMPAVRLGLGDENRGVRFIATMMVGRKKMTSFAPLVEPLLDDPSGSVRAAAIYALIQCDRPVDRSPLASLVTSEDLEVRANSAMILGLIGDPSAVPLLRAAMKVASPTKSPNAVRSVEMQVAEALFRLEGEQSDLEVIRAGLFAGEGDEELSALASQLCGSLKDEASMKTLAWIGWRPEPPVPAEVRMAAATGLARINPFIGGGEALQPGPLLSHVGSEEPALRAQAAIGLGWFRSPEVLPTLSTMIRDRNAMVQVAAAGAILRALGA
ncbi:MAG: HEAT repeat domain-containing protein [Phycisphaerales bacterium]